VERGEREKTAVRRDLFRRGYSTAGLAGGS
jgi:hypothetical protein